MKVNNYLETEAIEEPPGVLRRVVIGADDGAPTFVMRVFEIKPGSSTPFHSHSWEHEVFVLSGKGIVKGEGKGKPVGEGTVVFVAPNKKHCFTNTGSDVLRFICVIPLPDMVTP
ncbi:MAG TPA: cupin domain-containing protein [Dehalococcoidia bacterium]|nr:cupin domain-containing protein [Dehalococcoidia bacterium]